LKQSTKTRKLDQKDLPDSYEGWENAAAKVLSSEDFAYLHSGAGEERTSQANLDAFYKWRIMPRVLRDVAHRNVSTTLLGSQIAAPVLIAPMGGNKNLDPSGEIGLGRAASSANVPFILSNVSSMSIEEVATGVGSAQRWFQLYPCKDLDVMISFLKRAKSAGYSAIVITVDRPAEYPRYGSAKSRAKRGRNMKNFVTDPVFQAKAKQLGKGEEELFDKIRINPSFGWGDVDSLRSEASGLPVLLKGILHPKDVELAIEHRINGVILSNHGGRRMDGEVASLDVLPQVANEVGEKLPILLDSGIRSGVDVVKAIALGAKAVLVGHLCAYGLAVAGEVGVRRVITNLIREIDSTLAICGCRSLGELDQTILTRVS
jgi:isopentenyl diphosphate isomerase/L-lactate dehydrogenase-like FMN-dependent dehydrogenase